MNDLPHPKRDATISIGIILFLALSLSLLWLPSSADAGPGLQPPRPTLPGEPPGGGPGEEDGEPGRPPGATIHGWVVNWNYHNEPHAKVRLRGGGWDLETFSDDNGYYYFKGLGADNVFLNLALPEGSDLTPMTTDRALRLKGSGQLMVNLGFYTGPTAPGWPVDISLSVEPDSAVQGDTVLYTIRVVNSLPHGISQVLVTDNLPPGLVPVEVTVSPIRVTPTPTATPTPTDTPGPPTATPTPGPPTATPRPLPPTATPTPTPPPPAVEIWDNLIIADIGEMAVEDTVVVIIEARVEGDVPPGTVIENWASFIYAESVAVQAMAPLTISGAGPTGARTETLTVTATVAEEELVAAAAIPTAETPTTVVTPTVTTTPESPGDLPVTGFGLPIAGFLFALLILVARLLRPKPVNET
jgi:uncharacterized repeat protein (TIGR01451 family)